MGRDFITVVVVLLIGNAACSDPCADYKEIGYEYRSTAYKKPSSEPYMCDVNLIKEPGFWYHFDQYTGNMMPTYCPDKSQCGTLYPVWMNGTHPTSPGEELDAVACTHNFGCCTWPKPMKVKLCEVNGTRFYVYQLPPVEGCPSSYCAGEQMPCQFYEVWDPIKEKCIVPPNTTSAATTTGITPTLPTTTMSSPTTAIQSSKSKQPTTELAKPPSPTHGPTAISTKQTTTSSDHFNIATTQPMTSTERDGQLSMLWWGLIAGGFTALGAAFAFILMYCAKRNRHPKNLPTDASKIPTVMTDGDLKLNYQPYETLPSPCKVPLSENIYASLRSDKTYETINDVC